MVDLIIEAVGALDLIVLAGLLARRNISPGRRQLPDIDNPLNEVCIF
jgi:hypothetical protein